jgi:hypothetical protein
MLLIISGGSNHHFQNRLPAPLLGNQQNSLLPKRKLHTPKNKGMTRHGTEEARQRKNDQPFKLYCKKSLSSSSKIYFKNLIHTFQHMHLISQGEMGRPLLLKMYTFGYFLSFLSLVAKIKIR